MKLSDEVIDELHSFTMTEVEYKLMWARTYLKNYGAVENSRQGVWALTSKGVKLACVDNIDTKEIIDFTNKKRALAQSDVKIDAAVEEHNDWRKSISDILHSIDPYAFERLAQRLLKNHRDRFIDPKE